MIEDPKPWQDSLLPGDETISVTFTRPSLQTLLMYGSKERLLFPKKKTRGLTVIGRR